MGRAVTKVIEVVAPIALEALAAAATELLAGETADVRVRSLLSAGDPPDWGATIYNDTTSYISTQFADTYGYYYQGLRSKPTTGQLPTSAGMDIVVYDATNDIADIGTYLQSVFKDSLNPSDSIELANNLAQLIQERFAEQSLEWTPFDKRYNFPDNVIVDAYMVTACARDVAGKNAGVVTYCFVTYGD